MPELKALVSALEMREGGPRRWYLVRGDVLFAECEWSWTQRRAEATRLPSDLAEALSHERRKELPMLPTEAGPLMPMFVAPFYGADEPPEGPAPAVLPEPRPPLPPRGGMKSVKERTEIAKRGCVTRRFNAAQAMHEWQEAHEEA